MPSTWWDGVHYDRILLDAPCTATGVIRRHPDIKLLRKQDDVAALVSRQQALLESLWPAVALADARRYVAVLYLFCAGRREQ
jgi:16S rRNA (cytosine967-C5)-methyltransferase